MEPPVHEEEQTPRLEVVDRTAAVSPVSGSPDENSWFERDDVDDYEYEDDEMDGDYYEDGDDVPDEEAWGEPAPMEYFLADANTGCRQPQAGFVDRSAEAPPPSQSPLSVKDVDDVIGDEPALHRLAELEDRIVDNPPHTDPDVEMDDIPIPGSSLPKPPPLIPVEDFAYKRYGLLVSGDVVPTAEARWPQRLGLKGRTLTSYIQLHDSFLQGVWPPKICDLSPDTSHPGFSTRFRGPRIWIRHSTATTLQGYIITLTRHPPVNWKIFIEDPLTILQIDREGWDHDPDNLVANLVRKGLPFKILNPERLEPGSFVPHLNSFPVPHFDRQLDRADYINYQNEALRFFQAYPHAYAAALSAGGVLRRIAMDVLPSPQESDITRLFHLEACSEAVVNGVHYWTPDLTNAQEDVVIGVSTCPLSCKAPYINSAETFYLRDTAFRQDGHLSWWPRCTNWDSSGLDLGAWSPTDEFWYTERKAALMASTAGPVRTRDWKKRLKYDPANLPFLVAARALARTSVATLRP